MQANEFEKNIQNKLDSFKLVPADEVWNKVAERIALQRRKRRAGWWLFSGIFLCGGILLWFLKTEKYDIVPSAKTSTSISQETNNLPVAKDKQEGKLKDATVTEQHEKSADTLNTNKQSIAKLQAKPEHENEWGNAAAESLSTKTKSNKSKTQNSFPNAPLIRSSDKLSSGKEIESKAMNHFPATGKTIVDSLLPSNNEEHSITYDNLKAKNEKETIAAKPDTFKSNQQSKPLATKKGKWKHGFNIYAGISDNKTSVLQTANESAVLYSPVNSFDSRATSNLYTAAFSFGLGGFTRKQLNEKFYFTAGLDYHFYQAKSWVGNKVGEPFNAYDSSLLQGVSVNEYYRSGGSVHFSNQYHFLQLPLTISYQLNKSKQRPLLVGAGISPSWLIGARALFNNQSKGIAYTDNTQFHLFQLSIHANISFTLKDAKGYQIEAGPMFQCQLNNLSKPVNAEKQQLIFTGIKANFIFK